MIAINLGPYYAYIIRESHSVESLYYHCNPSKHIPYGGKFWQGIYYGGLVVSRTIHHYFICQKCHSVMSSLLQNHSLCTRPAAKRANLIVGMESPLKPAYEDIASPKSFVHRRRRVGLSVNARKAIQTTCAWSL